MLEYLNYDGSPIQSMHSDSEELQFVVEDEGFEIPFENDAILTDSETDFPVWEEKHCQATLSEFKAELNSLTLLHLNIRGFRSHLHDLSGFLDLVVPRPHLIALNETFLDPTLTSAITGYTLISRLDRPGFVPDVDDLSIHN